MVLLVSTQSKGQSCRQRLLRNPGSLDASIKGCVRSLPDNSGSAKVVVARAQVRVGRQKVQSILHTNLNHDAEYFLGLLRRRNNTKLSEKMPGLNVVP